MTSRDLISNVKVVSHVTAQAITATNTPSNGVDLAGFESVMIAISIGAITNIANSPKPSWSFKIQVSDSVSSGFTDVTDSNALIISSSNALVTAPNASTGVFLVVDAAAEDETVYTVGLLTTKRYARVVATAANTPGSTPYAVNFTLGDPSLSPTKH
jgi:hypothetical protein